MLDEIARLRPAEVLVPELPSGRPHDIAGRIEQLGVRAVTPRPGWHFTPHHAGEQIRKQWQVKTAGGFGFADDDPGGARDRGGSDLSGRNAEDRPVAPSAAAAACGRGSSEHRSGKLAQPGDRSHHPLAAAPRARSSRRSTAPAPPWAAVCCGNGFARHCAMLNIFWPARRPSPRCWNPRNVAGRRREAGRTSAISSGSSAGWRWAGPARAICRHWPNACARCPELLDKLAVAFQAKRSRAGTGGAAAVLRRAGEISGRRGEVRSAAASREGGVIADGFDPELDRLRDIGSNSQQWLAKYQARLAAESDIPSLQRRLQQSVRLLHRSHRIASREVPAVLVAQADGEKRRAICHGRVEEVRGRGAGAQDRAIALEQTVV